ncbi:MAG: hypothetical protein ABWZ36_04225, partial [Jiangellaceae bacterium]
MPDEPGEARRVTSLDAVKPAKRAVRTVRAEPAVATGVKPTAARARRTKPAAAKRVPPTATTTRSTGRATDDKPPATSAREGGTKPVDEVLKLVGELVRHVIGNDGDEKVEQALDFLRRRLTGDYEVDEFGFDEQLTDTVL